MASRKSIELDPNLFQSHFLLASVLMRQRKSQEAEQALRKTITLNPNFPDAYSNLGNILRDHGKFREAELLTRKAIELKPDFIEAHSNLAHILNYQNISLIKKRVSILKTMIINVLNIPFNVDFTKCMKNHIQNVLHIIRN